MGKINVAGGGGNVAWLQQYTGANSVLKKDKGKDVGVKTGEYVYNEFYEVAVVPVDGDLKVKSLLHMDGTDASTTFTDETGRIWTANGNAQIDISEKKFGTGSVLFDGSSWINTPICDDFNLGGSDFTIDLWVNPSILGSIGFIYGTNDTGSSNGSIGIAKLAGDNVYVSIYKDGDSSISGTITSNDVLELNIWHHIAITCLNNLVTLYINGVSNGTYDLGASVLQDALNLPTIGRNGAYTSSPFKGHIDEVRFSKGIVRWTENFTPPTQSYDFALSQIIPPTTQAETIGADVLLLHMDGTDASTIFTDESGKIWTANGNAQIDTADSKFGGASGIFDGSSWIDTLDDKDFDLSDNDFTIDFWAKRIGLPSGAEYVAGQADSSGNNASILLYLLSDGTLIARAWDENSTLKQIQSTTVIADGSFKHIALVRKNGELKLYINGTEEGTSQICATSYFSSFKFSIGRYGEVDGSCFNGYIDEFRFINGEAKWTTNFTPPTAPHIYNEGTLNLMSTIDGTLEMANPEIDQVYQGFVSKENLWDGNMEGYGFSNIKSIQNGVAVLNNETLDIAISKIDLEKSIILISFNGVESYNFKANNILVEAFFTNAETLTLQRNTSTYSVKVSWQVIEYVNVKSLQTGLYIFDATDNLIQNIAISAVDISKALLVTSMRSDYTDDFIPDLFLRKALINATTIEIEKYLLRSGYKWYIRWYVLEFN